MRVYMCLCISLGLFFVNIHVLFWNHQVFTWHCDLYCLQRKIIQVEDRHQALATAEKIRDSNNLKQ